MKKIIAALCIALVVNLLVCSTGYAMSDNSKNRTSKVRKGILSLGRGPDARIKVILHDNTEVRGFITQSDEEGFSVTNSETNQTSRIDYSQVKKAQGKNKNSGRWLVIGFVAAFVVLVFIVALVSDDH
jgi:hypothetical protein